MCERRRRTRWRVMAVPIDTYGFGHSRITLQKMMRVTKAEFSILKLQSKNCTSYFISSATSSVRHSVLCTSAVVRKAASNSSRFSPSWYHIMATTVAPLKDNDKPEGNHEDRGKSWDISQRRGCCTTRLEGFPCFLVCVDWIIFGDDSFPTWSKKATDPIVTLPITSNLLLWVQHWLILLLDDSVIQALNRTNKVCHFQIQNQQIWSI